MSTERDASGPLPAVDERLIMPDTRYEVVDGEVVYVPPALEPHGNRHSKLSALLEAYAGGDYQVASDMLTRTSEKGDMAPDVSVYPAARDPETGGRQLEELAFEVVSTERLSAAGRKAAALAARGVRRVFAVDVERERALEWSRATSAWEILAMDGAIDDRTLALPLCVHDLVTAARADDAIARALLAKRNPVLLAAIDEGRAEGKIQGKAEGKAEAVLAVLEGRGLPIAARERETVLATRDPARLDAWLAAVGACASVADLLALGDSTTTRS